MVISDWVIGYLYKEKDKDILRSLADEATIWEHIKTHGPYNFSKNIVEKDSPADTIWILKSKLIR